MVHCILALGRVVTVGVVCCTLVGGKAVLEVGSDLLEYILTS